MKLSGIFSSCLVSMIFISCGNKAPGDVQPVHDAPAPVQAVSPEPKDTFPCGQVIPSIVCRTDGTQSYGLYLPSHMEKGKKYPIVFFFDSHARGKMPLSKYKRLADRYGFILTCSNNSQNNMDPQEINRIKTILFDDALSRLPVDSQNIFTGGFSGGARVAIGITVQDERIRGLIANSASFDPKQQPIRPSVCYVGMVGDEDFNYGELKGTETAFNDFPNAHDLLVFEGKHDWAPETEMDEAFLFLYLEAVRAKRIQKNDTLIDRMYARDDRMAQRALALQTNPLRKAEMCRRMYSYFHDLKPVTMYESLLKRLKADPGFSTALADESAACVKEQGEEEDYRRYIRGKDLKWWQEEVARLLKEIRNNPKKEIAKHDRRLLAAMSLVAYMNANGGVRHADQPVPKAADYVTIYKTVDPDNPEWAFLYACLCGRLNDVPGALLHMSEAVKLGFNDAERALKSPELQQLQSDPKFQELVAKIKPEKD